jgi:hypothetical protein
MGEQWGQQRLVKFIQRRGGTVTVRELMQSYAPLKNHRGKAEAALNALSAIDYGKWSLFSTTEKGGRPTRFFKFLPYLRNLCRS